MSNPKPLPISVRVYPEASNLMSKPKVLNITNRRAWRLPNAMLVFDTETRVDSTQRLTFGSYRYIIEGVCLEEGLFYAPDLPEADHKILENYEWIHPANASNKILKLLTLKQFLKRFYSAVYKERCLLVGFNVPFDLSRIACSFSTARGRFAGGFSFGLWSYLDDSGEERKHQYRPRVAIKHIDGNAPSRVLRPETRVIPSILFRMDLPTENRKRVTYSVVIFWICERWRLHLPIEDILWHLLAMHSK